MRSRTHISLVWFLLSAVACLLSAVPPHAQMISKEPPEAAQGIGITDRTGTELPNNLVFIDAEGREVTSASFFDGERPVVLLMAYYECPLLCTITMNSLQDALNGMDWVAGREFRVLTISFNHRESTRQAAQQQGAYRLGYTHADEMPDDGWNFYTADPKNVRALADAIGFSYKYLPESGEFSHPSALFFFTPDGTLHNFIEHLKFEPLQIELALQEASDGTRGTIWDRIQFNCFTYDSTQGKYTANVMQIMKYGAGGIGLLVVLGVAVLFCVFEFRRKAAPKTPQDLAGLSNDAHPNTDPEPVSP